MLLVLLRHGIAIDSDKFDGADEDRPLTPAGILKTTQACRGLATVMGRVDKLVTSPKLRALHTARLFKQQSNEFQPSGSSLRLGQWSELGALDPQPLVIRLGREKASRVVCVGHEPLLSALVAHLVAGQASGLQIILKKSGALALDVDWRTGRANLLWLLTPRQLRQIGREQGAHDARE